jgi:hypothetical protein
MTVTTLHGSSAPTEALLARLASRHDLSIRLSADEVAELTERVLEPSDHVAGLDAQLVALDSYIRLLEPHDCSERSIEVAIEALLRGREERLSNVITRKAYELERMLLGLLPRLDAPYQSDAKYPTPLGRVGSPDRGKRSHVQYQVRARRGHLMVKVRHLPHDDVRQTLFTIDVWSSRPRTFWQQLRGKKSGGKAVVVSAPTFTGETLESLLTWMLKTKSSGSPIGIAVGFALEKLANAVVHEVDAAVEYVSTLDFDTDGVG